MFRSSWLSSPWAIRLIPTFVLVLLGALWGGIPSIAKYVIQEGVTPLSYSFWIMSIAASVLVIINYLRGVRFRGRHYLFYFICGVSGSALPTTIMYYCLIEIPAGLMVILLTVTPIFTYILALTFSVEKYHNLKTLGILLAFVGLFLILMPDSVTDMSAPVVYVLTALFTPFFYAANIVYTKKYRPLNLNTMEMTAGMLIMAAVSLFIVTIIVEPLYPLWNAEDIISLLMLYHGMLTAVAFCMFYWLIERAGALFSSQVTYSVTLFGIVIGAYVHNEILPALVWVAAFLMLISCWLIQRSDRPTRPAVQ